ncbi:hypothetical protein CDCA_CDCA03G0839 [Cyanidium caldarium]|uniref:Protein kinase domain-containing protein n=1 Tax=Cyanidium caldarium TaxID=2771 RepID=A0AAV9IRN7_CYACA|nr:hypothetical protein CDCA_CDCA03G0839 [Cyanidium caldarium]
MAAASSSRRAKTHTARVRSTGGKRGASRLGLAQRGRTPSPAPSSPCAVAQRLTRSARVRVMAAREAEASGVEARADTTHGEAMASDGAEGTRGGEAGGSVRQTTIQEMFRRGAVEAPPTTTAQVEAPRAPQPTQLYLPLEWANSERTENLAPTPIPCTPDLGAVTESQSWIDPASFRTPRYGGVGAWAGNDAIAPCGNALDTAWRNPPRSPSPVMKRLHAIQATAAAAARASDAQGNGLRPPLKHLQPQPLALNAVDGQPDVEEASQLSIQAGGTQSTLVSQDTAAMLQARRRAVQGARTRGGVVTRIAFSQVADRDVKAAPETLQDAPVNREGASAGVRRVARQLCMPDGTQGHDGTADATAPAEQMAVEFSEAQLDDVPADTDAARATCETPINPYLHGLVALSPGGRGRAALKRRKQLLGANATQSSSRYLDHFDELKVLGTGIKGLVVKVRDRLDGCLYAVKKTTRPLVHRAERREALREVHALAALGEHPHIVRYHTAWFEEQQTKLYLQLEYCDGGSLSHGARHQRLPHGGRLPLAEVERVFEHMALALTHCHAHGMVHMDVKPDNMLCCRRRTLVASGETVRDARTDDRAVFKLADFGLVCRSNGSDYAGNEGDSRYLCQSMFRDGARDDLAPVDVFALGISVYELVTGRALPTSGEEWRALRAGQLCHLDALDVEQATPEERNALAFLSTWIRACMRPVPASRPSAAQLAHAFATHRQERMARQLVAR